MELKAYRWHSINLIPHIEVCPCDEWDEATNTIGRLLMLTVFGWVITMVWRSKKQLGWSFPYGIKGPLYSRKRKIWYSAGNVGYIREAGKAK